MTGTIHLVRHAESVHNVDKDFNRLDPGLTPLGTQQASALGQIFPYPSKIGLIITSPLRRTVQTALLAFRKVLDKRYFPEDSEGGIERGAALILDSNLQERSDLPCDTGSDRRVLEVEFPGLDFSTLPEDWTSKKGSYAADDDAVETRARKARGNLRERMAVLETGEKSDIVVVTHGVFMKFLSGDQAVDLPKAGWKSYTIVEDGARGIVLTPF